MDQDGKWTPEPHRVCNTCNDELNRIHKLIKDVLFRLLVEKIELGS